MTAFRFHADEALFAALGRAIAQDGDWLLLRTGLLVDKPPLFYLLVASGVSLEWASEWTARLPSLFASLITLALAYRLAADLWRDQWAGWWAALLLALSPFAIAFSPVVFADMLMVMVWLAAVLNHWRRRWWWAGLLIGAALMIKQNTLLLLPLFALLFAWGDRPHDSRDWRRLLVGLLLPLVMGLFWEILRSGGVSAWAVGVGGNNPGRLIRSDELWKHLVQWAGLARYFWGTRGALSLIILVLTGWSTVISPFNGRRFGLVLFALLYAAALWLIAFPIFDRYLLPVVAVIALLGAGPLKELTSGRWWLAGLVIVSLLPGALRVVSGFHPVGGDRGANDGIGQVAEYLDAQPEGSVVYTDGASWPLAYYLYDAYLLRVSITDADFLADDLRVNGEDGSVRVLVIRRDLGVETLAEAAARSGYQLGPVLLTYSRVKGYGWAVYQLLPCEQASRPGPSMLKSRNIANLVHPE